MPPAESKKKYTLAFVMRATLAEMRELNIGRQLELLIEFPFRLLWDIVIVVTAICLEVVWVAFLFSTVVGAILVLIFFPLEAFLLPLCIIPPLLVPLWPETKDEPDKHNPRENVIDEPRTENVEVKKIEEISPEKSLINAVKEFRESIDEISNKQKISYKNAIKSDKDKLDNAIKICAETKIGDALCRFLEEVLYYPSWSKNKDYELKLPIKILDSTESDEDNTTKIHFKYEEETYSFIFKFYEPSSMFPDLSKSGDIKILSNGEEVIVIGFTKSSTRDEYSILPSYDLKSFKFGKWIKDFIEIDGKLRLIKEKEKLDFEQEKLKKRAGNIS